MSSWPSVHYTSVYMVLSRRGRIVTRHETRPGSEAKEVIADHQLKSGPCEIEILPQNQPESLQFWISGTWASQPD